MRNDIGTAIGIDEHGWPTNEANRSVGSYDIKMPIVLPPHCPTEDAVALRSFKHVTFQSIVYFKKKSYLLNFVVRSNAV